MYWGIAWDLRPPFGQLDLVSWICKLNCFFFFFPIFLNRILTNFNLNWCCLIWKRNTSGIPTLQFVRLCEVCVCTYRRSPNRFHSSAKFWVCLSHYCFSMPEALQFKKEKAHLLNRHWRKDRHLGLWRPLCCMHSPMFCIPHVSHPCFCILTKSGPLFPAFFFFFCNHLSHNMHAVCVYFCSGGCNLVDWSKCVTNVSAFWCY